MGSFGSFNEAVDLQPFLDALKQIVELIIKLFSFLRSKEDGAAEEESETEG